MDYRDQALHIQNNKNYYRLTVDGSSRGVSISAWRKNTLPLHALHNIRSKAGILSRRMTPATKLYYEQLSY